MPNPKEPPPGDPGDGSRHLTWPDVAVLIVVIGVVIGFVIYLMSRGLTPRDAMITAITTTAAVLGLLLLPRRVTEALRLLRAIARSVSHPGPGGT
ncbi:MAG TPA: hypothetical protein VF070_41810 [Streptosporangiaceae bacterium]